LPLYTIELDRLAELGASAEKSAERFGWRYIVYEGDSAFLVDLVGGPNGRLQAYSVSSGAGASQLAAAAVAAERGLADDGPYEARILEVRLAGLSALWLHQPGRSVLLDLDEPEPRLQPLEQALVAAQARAQARLSAVEASAASAEDGG
jgi:hypothetical protein